MAKISRFESWILRVMASGCLAMIVCFFIGIAIVASYVRTATATVQQLTQHGDIRQIALDWIVNNNRFDDLKAVLDTVVRWLERIVLIDHATGHATSILIDVSNDGEFGFLARYMSKFNRVPEERVIVDIGAFDGLMSSNSFNFIQAGWDAVIVEPYPPLMQKAKRHVERYHSGAQRVQFAPVAIADQDGEAFLNVFENTGLQNSLLNISMGARQSSGNGVRVRTMTVRTLLKTYEVPQRFGVLSIDAEGLSHTIVSALLASEYRPQYIIAEWLGSEHSGMSDDLARHGYVPLANIGMNGVWTHAGS